MGEVASSYVSIVPKISDNFGKQLETQMRKSAAGAFGPIDQESKKQGDKSGKTFGSSFKSVAGPMLALASVGAITAMVKSSVDDFAKLEDSTDAAAVVFGDAMNIIVAQSEKAATAMGLSKQETIDANMMFGVYGQSAGLAGAGLANFSTKLTGLAADMSSFTGKSTEQAIEAVGSAMRGEMEPIRAFGVNIDDLSLRQEALKMGLISTTKDALTPQNKVLASQSLILAKTTIMQGNFRDTAGSTANTQKTLQKSTADLSAEIGQKLAPMIVEAQKAGLSWIKIISDNQAALIPLAASLATVAAAIGGVVLVGKGMEALKTARDTVKGLGDAFSTMGTKAKVATVSMGVIGVAVVAAGLIYGAFAQKQADAQAAVEDYTAAIEADSGALAENVRNTIAKRLEDSGALKAAQTLGIGLSDVTDAVLTGGAAMDKVKGIIASHSGEMGEQTAESVRAGEAARVLTGLLGGENTELNNAVDSEKRKAEATSTGTDATKSNSDATKKNSEELQKNVDKLNKQYDARLKLRGDKRSLEAAIDGATESLKKNGKTLDIHTEKGRANQEALDGIVSAGKAVGGNMTKSQDAFVKAAHAMGMDEKIARKLAISLGLIKPKKVKIQVDFVKTETGSRFAAGLDYFGNPIKKAGGGPITGPGSGTSDSILAAVSNGEHVLTAAEVRAMGGQAAVSRFRASVRAGSAGRFANGGPVGAVAAGGSSMNMTIVGADSAEVAARAQAAWRHDMSRMAVQS